ncbi:MAG: MAPEG family protein [Proteobacteria bacterium]|nr:MAPEG family protein [Pseudomonadota bacterium]
MQGAPEFERISRVQQNTLEQLIVLLPAMWLFAFYVHPVIAAGLGVLFLIARIIYCRAYLREPSSRGPGFAIGQIAQATLLLGGLIGAVLDLLN